MRFFLLLTLMTVISVPAMAQDDAATEVPEPTAMELATKMHEIWPVATRVEEAVNAVAEDVPANERQAFKTRMRKAIDQKQLEKESIDAMAQVFSQKELQAMVDFYGSPEGRSVSAKTEDYMAILQPIMVKMLDSALLKMRTGEPSASDTETAQ